MKFQFPFAALLVGVAAQSAIITELNEKISPQVTRLANDVQEFPGSGQSGAVAIDSDSKDLVTILNTAAQNVRKIGSFSPADGTVIIADIEAIVLTGYEMFSDFSVKKDDFNRLVPPAGQLILSDLQSLNQSTIDYANALVEAAPAFMQVQFVLIRNTFADGFATIIADYTP